MAGVGSQQHNPEAPILELNVTAAFIVDKETRDSDFRSFPSWPIPLHLRVKFLQKVYKLWTIGELVGLNVNCA